MAKSSTLKKSENKLSLVNDEKYLHVEKTINKTVLYIKQWTRNELLELLENENSTPLCVKINNSKFLIGKFLIKQSGIFWTVQELFTNKKHIFSSRTVAVIYSLCECKHYSKLALEILRHNTNIINLSEDLILYRHLKNTAKNKHDTWKIDHYTIMESSIRYKLKDAKIHLEKSLHLAKYFKI